jgi:outer membrane protein assembly factor BamB
MNSLKGKMWWLGLVVILALGGNLGAFQATQPAPGTLKWRFKADAIVASPALGVDGTIYVGSLKLYAFHPDGALKWQSSLDLGIVDSPAIGADGTIYVVGGAGLSALYAFHPDGTLRWIFEPFPGGAWAAPAIGADGTIYIGSLADVFYAINPDGTLKWRFITWGTGVVRSSAAIGTDGTIYFGTQDGAFYALNPDGTMKWRFQTRISVQSSPAIGADGTIYFGSWDWYFYALHSSSLGIANSPWPMFRHDPQRTGRVSGSRR